MKYKTKLKKKNEDFEKAFGSWRYIEGSSVEYVKNIRKGWEKRAKILGLR